MAAIDTGVVLSGKILVIASGRVNFYLIKSGEKYIAIDTGLEKEQSIAGLQKLGIDPKDIAHILLTHSDSDHASGIELFPNAIVHLPALEEPMINGQVKRFWGHFNSLSAKSYELLTDGQTLTLLEETITCIATPGHTPGSMSYILSGTLFTGDTLSLKQGQVRPFKRIANMDTKLQKRSITKLQKLTSIRRICTAHFGMTEDFAGAFEKWKG